MSEELAESSAETQEGVQTAVADVTESTADSKEQEGEQPEKAEKTRHEKLLAEKAFETREAKRLAKAETEKREELERELESLRKGEGLEPKADDFESYEDYQKASNRWTVNEILKERDKASADGRKKSEEIERETRKAVKIESVMADGSDTYKDFDDVMQKLNASVENPEKTTEAFETILESNLARDLLYYLGKNPAIVAKLSEMSPRNQAKEIGRLESLFESKKLSAAPDPIQNLKGTGSRVTSNTPPTDPAKFREWEAKQK
jgi:hypothetical protein